MNVMSMDIRMIGSWHRIQMIFLSYHEILDIGIIKEGMSSKGCHHRSQADIPYLNRPILYTNDGGWNNSLEHCVRRLSIPTFGRILGECVRV